MLFGVCSNKNSKFIVGCDSNTHHIIWGSIGWNNGGDILLGHIFVHNLYILNKGNEHTFLISNRSEVLGLTFCSNNIYESVHDWCVSNEVTLSTHKLISFPLSGQTPKKSKGGIPRELNGILTCETWRKCSVNLKFMKLSSENDWVSFWIKKAVFAPLGWCLVVLVFWP